MLAIGLAFTAAVAYGLSDFLAGVHARRAHYAWVVVVSQWVITGGAVLIAVLWWAQGGPGVSLHGVVIGLVAASGHVLGTLQLYRGLADGAMHVAAPLSAVCGAGIPVVVGLVLGERPGLLTALGLIVALPAVWLVGSGADDDVAHPAHRRPGVVPGLLAGVGFAVYFLAYGQASPAEGLWPLAVTAAASLLALLIYVRVTRPAGTWRDARAAWTVGATALPAMVAYFLAARIGMLAVVPVVTSLYAAFTVLLAMVRLHERPTRPQLWGLGLSGVAVALIAAAGG